jgi:hypothetical protein
VSPADLGALIYAGVCRENFEPATACAVADGLGLRGGTFVYDLSNACLGLLNGMLQVANMIELGQIRAGLVVACESAREINEIALARLLPAGDMAEYCPITEQFGNLVAICPDCDVIMNRRVSLVKIEQIRGKMEIGFPEAVQHIIDRASPTVNSDLRKGSSGHAKSPSSQ